MKASIFHFVVGLSLYIRTATTQSETVWLRDVTTRFQRDKRTLNDPDLPDHLSFHLKHKSHALTLNLKRNHHIDPNADVYIVRKSRDGQSLLEKIRNLEKEDVAYYQDRENGAFMIAQCVKISNGLCDILINGNVRIGDRRYDLRPSESDVTSRNFLETTGLLDKLYVLQEQGYSQREMSAEHDLQPSETDVSSRNLLETTGLLDKRYGPQEQDTIRNLKKEYYVEALVLVDSSVYELFVSMVTMTIMSNRQRKEAQKNTRKWYSHIINGADLLYKGIEDPNIEVSVIIRAFVFFEREDHFPHTLSRLEIVNGTKRINAEAYIIDLNRWDTNSRNVLQLPQYDQVILFTRHQMYLGNTHAAGISFRGGVCDMRTRAQIVHSTDYFHTVLTTAHELGHSLGAWHDGDMNARACKSEDHFIMSPESPTFDPTKEYSRNPWLFSKCSVEAFKNTLKNKTCLISKGNYSDGELSEWKMFMSKLPGQEHDPDKQCHIINGHGSIYCGKLPGMICRFMYCTDPKTGRCVDKYFGAATGTACGINMWCKEGLCVHKARNRFQ